MRKVFCDWCEVELGDKGDRLVERDIEVKSGSESHGHVSLELCERCAIAVGLWLPNSRHSGATENIVEQLRAVAHQRLQCTDALVLRKRKE